MSFDPLTFGLGANTIIIKPPHVLWYYVTLDFIYQIFHFKHYKNINFENSYFIEILFKQNDSILFFSFNNVHNYIYFLLKV
jgi:hypothetical protein